MSRPISLTIKPGPIMPAQQLRPGTKLAPGMHFKADGTAAHIVKETDEGNWLAAMKLKSDQSFVLGSVFEVPDDDMYQFELRHAGTVSIKIDGKVMYDEKQKDPDWNYIPMHLAKGHHYFQLTGVGAQPTGMEIRFGSSGVTNLDETRFQHPTKAN